MKPLIGFVLAIAAVFAADTKPNMTKAEHKAEAARHSTRAEESAAKARKHEANVERLATPGYNAMQHKWPGHSSDQLQSEMARSQVQNGHSVNRVNLHPKLRSRHFGSKDQLHLQPDCVAHHQFRDMSAVR